MKILVTGGAGFIGSHVVDRYVAEGHEVVVIDDLSTGLQENLNPGATFYKLCIEDPAIERLFQDHRPEIVNHHAAQMDVRRSMADPIFDANVNVLGTLILLQNCVKYGVERFIFASTGGAIYGEQEQFPADETHPTRPLSPYGVSKLAGESYLYFYKMAYGLNYTVLRYSNVYGPRQNPHGEAGVVAIFVKKLLKGENPIIYGDGHQMRDFVYVGDVVESNLIALDNDKSGIFNIGTGLETDINTIFRMLVEITDANAEEVHASPRQGEQRRSAISFKKAYKLLGWMPKTSLQEGINRTVEFFQNGDPSQGV